MSFGTGYVRAFRIEVILTDEFGVAGGEVVAEFTAYTLGVDEVRRGMVPDRWGQRSEFEMVYLATRSISHEKEAVGQSLSYSGCHYGTAQMRWGTRYGEEGLRTTPAEGDKAIISAAQRIKQNLPSIFPFGCRLV